MLITHQYIPQSCFWVLMHDRNQIWIVITLFRFIWHQTEFSLVEIPKSSGDIYFLLLSIFSANIRHFHLILVRANLTRVKSFRKSTSRHFPSYLFLALLLYISFLSFTFPGAPYQIFLVFFPGFLANFILLSNNIDIY